MATMPGRAGLHQVAPGLPRSPPGSGGPCSRHSSVTHQVDGTRSRNAKYSGRSERARTRSTTSVTGSAVGSSGSAVDVDPGDDLVHPLLDGREQHGLERSEVVFDRLLGVTTGGRSRGSVVSRREPHLGERSAASSTFARVASPFAIRAVARCSVRMSGSSASVSQRSAQIGWHVHRCGACSRSPTSLPSATSSPAPPRWRTGAPSRIGQARHTADAVWAMPASPLVGLPASELNAGAIIAGVRDRSAAGDPGPGAAAGTCSPRCTWRSTARKCRPTVNSAFLFLDEVTGAASARVERPLRGHRPPTVPSGSCSPDRPRTTANAIQRGRALSPSLDVLLDGAHVPHALANPLKSPSMWGC